MTNYIHFTTEEGKKLIQKAFQFIMDTPMEYMEGDTAPLYRKYQKYAYRVRYLHKLHTITQKLTDALKAYSFEAVKMLVLKTAMQYEMIVGYAFEDNEKGIPHKLQYVYIRPTRRSYEIYYEMFKKFPEQMPKNYKNMAK